MGQRVGLQATVSRLVGIAGAVVALSLAVPAASVAGIAPQLLFNFPAGHGYTLLGSASSTDGKGVVSFQLDKSKLQGGDIYSEQMYGFSGFAGTYSVNSGHTKATVSANLGAYGSVSLTFGDARAGKVETIKCPGSTKKTTLGKGEKVGTVTGSLKFHSQTSYFGTVSGHKSTRAELVPLGAFLSTRQAAAGPIAAAAGSGGSSSGILACLPALTGKLTYLTLNAQGTTPSGEAGSNTVFATRLGNNTTISATDDLEPLDNGGVFTNRTISVTALGSHAGSGLYSFSSNLSKATAKAMGPFMSGSAKYTETTPCSNTTKVTYGSTTGAITAKFDVGGSVTYGGPGTVDEMDVIPAICDSPPPGAPQ